MFNELLHRASQGVLQNDIQHVIPQNTNIHIRVELDLTKTNDVSLYIKFNIYPKRTEIGHVSFHLYPDNPDYRNSIGILHVQNKASGKKPFRIQKRKTRKQIHLSLNSHNGIRLTNLVTMCTNHVLDILNRYLNPDEQHEPFSLLHSRTKKGVQQHPYFQIVFSSLQTKRIQFANTRKVRDAVISTSSNPLISKYVSDKNPTGKGGNL